MEQHNTTDNTTDALLYDAGSVTSQREFSVTFTIPTRMLRTDAVVAAQLRYVKGDFVVRSYVEKFETSGNTVSQLVMYFKREENARRCVERCKAMLGHYRLGVYDWEGE